MKNFLRTIIGILPVLLMINLSCYAQDPLKKPIDHFIHLDTTNIINEDSILLLSIENRNILRNRRILAQFSDSLLIHNNIESLLIELTHTSTTQLERVLKLKNQQIFPLKLENYELKSKKVNVYILILIILISGIIGGFARTKYSLLEDLEEKINGFEAANRNLKINDPSLNNQQSEMVESLMEITQEIKGFDKKNNYMVNILFGIIASSLSFLALTFFDSKILDFQTEMDYFIFLGWCLLGAVFAKKWIKSLYERITLK